MNSVMSIIFFVVSLICSIVSIRQFKGIGLLLNNEYLYRSKADRDKMTDEEKKPYYTQSGNVFLLLAIMSAVQGVEWAWQIGWLSYVSLGIMMITVIYVLMSTVRHYKKKVHKR